MVKSIKEAKYCCKGALNYSLKSFVPMMYRENLIKITWDSDCKGGHQAMVEAHRCYDEGLPLDDIIRYNEVDVVSTMQIQRYLLTLNIHI